MSNRAVREKKTTGKPQHLTFWVDWETYEEMEKIIKKLGISKSELIRRALNHYITFINNIEVLKAIMIADRMMRDKYLRDTDLFMKLIEELARIDASR
jgi:antitoxin component of RelBE/YafQ-DinJ toxin-antitoxin module